jgi:hypothetical protein
MENTHTYSAALIAAMAKSLAELAFIVESVAHLQGHERELLPVAERARALIAEANLGLGESDDEDMPSPEDEPGYVEFPHGEFPPL